MGVEEEDESLCFAWGRVENWKWSIVNGLAGELQLRSRMMRMMYPYLSVEF